MANENDNKLKILVKFPSRERPKKFFDVLDRYIMMSKDKDNIHYLISLDNDDPTLPLYQNKITQYQNITFVTGFSKGKIDACNRDVDRLELKWDILVLASDDMICQRIGWDETLREEMTMYYPELDGVLWHSDGFTHKRLNTMCILGYKRYKKFNYIYHPDYTSLWCDNEFMDVANRDGKQTYFDKVLFRHEHFSNGQQYNIQDALLKRNEAYFNKDKIVYFKRKTEGFPVNRINNIK